LGLAAKNSFDTLKGGRMTDFLLVILTAIIATFTVLVWQVYRQIGWFTGAMASNYETLVRIEAKRCNIPVVWWDPTAPGVEGDIWPDRGEEHSKSAELERIYLGFPKEKRARQPTCWTSVQSMWRSTMACACSIARMK
jgi:hypothetical protein